MTAQKQINTRLPEELIRAIKTLAKSEQRTVSQMIRVLIGEAVKAREPNGD